MEKNKKSINSEKILNIPNPITIIRILLSIILIYIVFKGVSLWTVAIIFAIAAFTDFLDGFLARKLDMVTNFGRKWDIIADRILMISIIITLILYLVFNNSLTSQKLMFMLLIMSREIISSPFLIISFFMKKGRPIPHVRWTGKLTTGLQGITFPMIVLGWHISLYFVIITLISGILSGCLYIYDSTIKPNNKFQLKQEEHYRTLS
jgi:CDP-diacylglycerol--glycerol-3-phosphate 3-phosphatidyltransferase